MTELDGLTAVESAPEIADTATIGSGVTFAGKGIVVGDGARLDPHCMIGEGVSIGRGALVRIGAVCLSDVPANAIVEGNPAQVVGYVQSADLEALPECRLYDFNSCKNLERPTSMALGVGGCELYLMRRISDPRGSLTVGEVPSEVPFAPERYFVVFDVPSMELRGEHAHKQCQQFLICLHGSCRVLLDDGAERCEVILDRPDMGVYMPEMIWGTQYRYSSDAVLLVFASRPYEASDYLRTYVEFLTELGRQKA